MEIIISTVAVVSGVSSTSEAAEVASRFVLDGVVKGVSGMGDEGSDRYKVIFEPEIFRPSGVSEPGEQPTGEDESEPGE